ncbi:MAG TPA: hypothetical protein VKG45_09435 [Actinomycetes bacterium]|nr:hypothetical protein [Actinomycetes bacterium]
MRLTSVLTTTSVLVGAFEGLTAGPHLGWLLPMTAVALLAAAVATRSSPLVGASAGMGAWLALARTLDGAPVAGLFSAGAQAAYAVAAALLLAVTVWQVATREWGPPPDRGAA